MKQHGSITSHIEFEFRWDVGLMNELDAENGAGINSPRVSDHTGTEWILRLYLNGNTADCIGHLSIFVQNCSKRAVKAKVNLGLMMTDGSKFCPCNDKPVMRYKACSRVGIVRVISRDKLFQEASTYLPGGRLVIYCRLSEVELESGPPIPLFGLSAALHNHGHFDITLVVGEVEVAAHRIVLSAASPVFKAMLEYDCQESRDGRVIISDLGSEAVLGMVAYLYEKSQLESADVDLCQQLLAAADKYQIEPLLQAMESRLIQQLSARNAVSTLIISDRHNATTLFNQVVEFIKQHPLQVITQPEWVAAIQTHSGLISCVHESIIERLVALQLD